MNNVAPTRTTDPEFFLPELQIKTLKPRFILRIYYLCFIYLPRYTITNTIIPAYVDFKVFGVRILICNHVQGG